MSEPVRRRLEQPSEEKARRSGCLTWGAVLGVLAGIMLGIYALPPILKHYYGETVIEADEFYRGSGKAIRFVSIVSVPADQREVAAGNRREDFEVTILGVVDDEWRPEISDFTLEFEELDEWQKAIGLLDDTPAGLAFRPGVELEYRLHFAVEYETARTDRLTPAALHLSNPRVKFKAPSP